MAVTSATTEVSFPAQSPAKLPTSSHRLPTISAAEAFQNLSDNDHGLAIPLTRLQKLDEVLGGGFESGKVTELWGPTGGGKSAIAVKAAQTALNRGGSVVWIDTASSICIHRLAFGVDHSRLIGLHHAVLPTLPHLLALLLHPPEAFPPSGTHLLVLTNLHTSLETSHPRNPSFAPTTRTDVQKWAAGRRYAVLGSIVVALNKLAAVHNISVIVTTGCATRMRSDLGPNSPLAVVPGVGGGEWDAGIWTRVAIFRDYNGRFVGVQKQRGVTISPAQGPVGLPIRFAIDDNGVATIDSVCDSNEPSSNTLRSPTHVSPVRTRKRAYEEVAGSDDEEADDEFGQWAELDDDTLANTGMPRVNEDIQNGAIDS